MGALPPPDEIRARAEQLGLISAGAALDSRTRAKVAQILVAEAAAAAAPAGDAVQLISRVRYPAEGGLIQVDVTFIPNPGRPRNG